MYYDEKSIEATYKACQDRIKKKFERTENDKKDIIEIIEEEVTKTIRKNILRGIGNRLLEERERNGKKQSDMIEECEKLGIKDASTISRWESGERAPKIEYLVLLSEQWGTDLNWLLTGTVLAHPTLPPELQTAMHVIAQYVRTQD